MPPRLVLASASPRRRSLLATLGVPFVVRPSRVPEPPVAGEPPARRALRLAAEKAHDVASGLRRPSWVLGADTLVVVGRRILEKPASRAAAERMLRLLSGRQHRVLTGICLEPAGLDEATAWRGRSTTRVTFAPLDAAAIRWLLAGGEYRDKAGAYAVQGRAAAYITGVAGSPSNVIGLPMAETARALAAAGYLPRAVRTRRPSPGRRRTRRRT